MYLRKFLIACCFLIGSTNVSASLISESFDVTVVSGWGLGTMGSITVAYDDADIIGTGDESLDGTMFSLSLDLFGQIFTNSDDIDFDFWPELLFSDGDIITIDYTIDELFGDNLTDIMDDRITHISGYDVIDNGWAVSTNIPEPSILILMFMGYVGLRAARKAK